MSISEAILTGESVPVEKHIQPLAAHDTPVGDRRNMAFKGTTVTSGRGTGIAVATGMRTELGKIAGMLDTRTDNETPLQRRLRAFGTRLAIAILAICAIIFAGGLLRGEPALLMFLTAVSLAVAAIPEALPATVTIALAAGARRMAEQNALVRRLSAVEALGSVTFICSDKTGTLTQNAMLLEACATSAGTHARPHHHLKAEPWDSLFRALALNTDAEVDGDRAVGDPTETALVRAAVERGLDVAGLRQRFPRKAEIPFDAVRKRMTTVHAHHDRYVAYTKGAPEAVIERCATILTSDGARPLDRAVWIAEAERLAAGGLRVLAVAERPLPALPAAGEDIEGDLVLLGLVGLMDPPRLETPAAVATCREAGITPVMITGDHPSTARAIARRLGILDHGGEVVTGRQLAAMSDAELDARVRDVRVYARVDPAQKIRVVEALQRQGEYVAVTGDGVNDAPALQKADIGVAMGRIGTDVARAASDLVLLDDNFGTIVVAVREGRRLYDNLRKVIKYVMTGNLAEVATVFIAPFVGLPLPLLPIQILWINLVTDGLPALALTLERGEADLMKRPPRPPRESPFAGGIWQHIVGVGLVLAALALATQAIGVAWGSPNWQTMVFTTITFSQAVLVIAVRSDTRSIRQMGLFSNPAVLAAAAVEIGLQLAIIYASAAPSDLPDHPAGRPRSCWCAPQPRRSCLRPQRRGSSSPAGAGPPPRSRIGRKSAP